MRANYNRVGKIFAAVAELGYYILRTVVGHNGDFIEVKPFGSERAERGRILGRIGNNLFVF